MAKTTDLAAAYAATTYRVFLPDGPCDLRIGQARPALADWLRKNGHTDWVIVTAHNPGSRLLSPADNAARQAALETALQAAGGVLLPAVNVPDATDWPAEAACFLAGPQVKRAYTFARECGQNALVSGDADGVAHLVWLNAAQG